MLGAGGRVDRIAPLSLRNGVLTSDPDVVLAEPFADARVATLAGAPYVAGLGGDGTPHLVQLQPAQAATRWLSLPGWPLGGAPSSMTAQNGALYLTVADRSGRAERMLRWSADRGWTARASVPGAVLAASGRAIGQAWPS